MTPGEFIHRWSGQEGGAERANYVMFLRELTDALDLPPPEPADSRSDYRFEYPVDGDFGQKLRIDLYRKDHFILEAKQSRLAGNPHNRSPKNEAPMADLFGHAPATRTGRRARWDADMGAAFRQARDYAHRLPAHHDRPPFLITCDVGRTFEFYSDFSGDGRAYHAFPDERRRIVTMEALEDVETQNFFRQLWTEPQMLDPTKKRIEITRLVAGYLAEVSKALEKRGKPPERVASFLGRVLFAMFAEDVGLLPQDSFKALLTRCQDEPETFRPHAEDLFRRMDQGGFSPGLGVTVPRFNGSFYHEAEAFDLERDEIGCLLHAAGRDWKSVEPAIFGTLFEQALDPVERARLGAHYTPRPYVERLVRETVMQPLREDWAVTRGAAVLKRDAGDRPGARQELLAFLEKLARTRVLDPACGTGNFLYVALELIKGLEGEVEAALAELEAEGEEQAGLEALKVRGVDPRTFLGLELNPRAARIAELVLWIGYLQAQKRRHGDDYVARDPVLEAFETINPPASRRQRTDACIDALMTHDGEIVGGGGEAYPNARRTPWPAADFIVGNPPFIGGKDIRAELGDAYVEALWRLNPQMDPGSDFVMYWWDRAADMLTRKDSPLRRFGLVTTNSITQVFQRRTVARWLSDANPNKRPLSLVFAVDDHPWTRATRDAAAVRIAMTVAEPGKREGVLAVVSAEAGLDTDAPIIELSLNPGVINPDLTVGVDVTRAVALRANAGLCSRGVSLHGAGFIISPAEAAYLGLGRDDRPGLDAHIRPYVNGRDITGRSRGKMVIDLFGLTEAEVTSRYPEVAQQIMATVKEDRARQFARSPTKDAADYLAKWWVFGKPRSELRPALAGLPRYMATVETSKHRTFQFLDGDVMPDNKLLVIPSDDAAHLAVLSSSIHFEWYLRNSGMLGVYDREAVYVKSRCFDPFPFPDLTDAQHTALAEAGEALDAFRKARMAEQPDLTVTRLYNALEAHRLGRVPEPGRPDSMTAEEAEDFQRGSVMVLADLHERIDRLTLEAYGWSADDDVLARLTALNAARAADEAIGHVLWLRPDYQRPRLARTEVAGERTGDLYGAAPDARTDRPAWPKDDRGRVMMLRGALIEAGAPLPAEAIAARFKGRGVGMDVPRLLEALLRDGQVRRYPTGYALLLAA